MALGVVDLSLFLRRLLRGERAKPWLLRLWRRLPGWGQGRVERLFLPKYLVGAMAVVVDDDDRVLLFRHTYRKEYVWGIPGGWLKAGEEPTDAVEREVYEESGLRVSALHPLVIGGDKALRRLDLIFLCTLDSGTFRPSAEVSEARFFSLEEMQDVVEPFHIQVGAYAAKVLAGEVYGHPPRSPK